ncbi:hypothetical protein Hanom_Chr09g00866851 [Helianthus anomalus]
MGLHLKVHKAWLNGYFGKQPGEAATAWVKVLDIWIKLGSISLYNLGSFFLIRVY